MRIPRSRILRELAVIIRTPGGFSSFGEWEGGNPVEVEVVCASHPDTGQDRELGEEGSRTEGRRFFWFSEEVDVQLAGPGQTTDRIRHDGVCLSGDRDSALQGLPCACGGKPSGGTIMAAGLLWKLGKHLLGGGRRRARMPRLKGIRVSGGEKLAAFAREVANNRRALSGTKIEVGFFDPLMARLAATHEFGQRDSDGGPKVPPRPAFRDALPRLRSEFRQSARRNLEGRRGLVTRSAVEAAAKAALGAIVESYRNAPGPEVGAAQQARKAGTPGEGRKLVGTRGEKLIGHLQARVNGEKLD